MSVLFRILRLLQSLMLVITVTSLSILRVYATNEPIMADHESLVVQDCTGTLIIKSGNVRLNGNMARTGATVINGSVISTSDNGSVIIDFGALGKIELGYLTLVTVDCVAGEIQVHTACGGKVRIEARSGQVNVKVPKVETILFGKHETYDDPVNFTAPSGSSILIECGNRKVSGLLVRPGLLGLLALLGVGAAVATGVVLGSGGVSSVGAPPVSGA